jgi:hypothetical protein
LCICLNCSNNVTFATVVKMKVITMNKVQNKLMGLLPFHLSLDRGPLMRRWSCASGGMGLNKRLKSQTQLAGTRRLKDDLRMDDKPPPTPPTSAMRLKWFTLSAPTSKVFGCFAKPMCDVVMISGSFQQFSDMRALRHHMEIPRYI